MDVPNKPGVVISRSTGKACQGQILKLIETDQKLPRKSNLVNATPGAIFTKLHFGHNL
jgi:hypothetical protein